MRIRRRAVGAPPPAQASSSPSSPQNRFPPAPPAPSPAPAPASVTAAARRVEPLEREVDRTPPEAACFDNGRPSGAGNLQEEETEERDEGSGKEKKISGGEEDARSGYEPGQRAVDVVCRKPVVPKREEEGVGHMEVEEEKKSEDSRPIEEKTAAAVLCKKGDGKGWHCKRAAQSGYSLCQYHLDKLRSYYSHSQTKKKKKKKKMTKPKPAPSPEKSTAAGVAQRQQKHKKNSSRVEDLQCHAMSTGPGVSDSFYYYSGFGPRWGKRRRCRSGDAAKSHDGGAAQAAQPSPHTAAAAPAAGVVEEGELECDSRGRDGQQRPWKSRALSSLP